MSLSPVAFFGALDPTNPVGTDSRTISDDQHRNILQSNRDQAPNWTGQITATHADLNTVAGYVAGGIKAMPGQATVTVLYAYNTATPPLQWTIEAPDTNVRELLIGPAAGGATIGGADDPTAYSQVISISGTTGGSTIGVGDITVTGTTDVGGNTYTAATGVNIAANSSSHTHPFTGTNPGTVAVPGQSFSGTDTATFTPRYARGILMKFTG